MTGDPSPSQAAASSEATTDATASSSNPEASTAPPAPARPLAWEDDISRNTLDTAPFENLPAPNTRGLDEYQNWVVRRSLGPLLGEQSIESLLARDPFPMPTPGDREGYCPGQDELYWLMGLEDHLKVMQATERHGVSPKSYLDFGCASGRVLRHFLAQTEIPELWGCDINWRHIRWILTHLPGRIKPIFNHTIPTLPIRDSSIDLISAFSVFTHIDTFETHWLAELHRILSDDGMIYATVHNEATWERLAGQIDNPDNRLVQSLLYCDPEAREKLQQPLPPTRLDFRFQQMGPYRCNVFHSNEYLNNVWGRFFEIAEILPYHHVLQTVVILKKKA